MTDMIERVARAIMEAREGSGKGSCQVKDWQSEYRENPHVKQAVDQAIAAIKTMRDLNEEMFDAAGFVYGADDIIPFWEAIIDAALGE